MINAKVSVMLQIQQEQVKQFSLKKQKKTQNKPGNTSIARFLSFSNGF